MSITISIPTLILIAIEVVSLIYVLTRDGDRGGMFSMSNRDGCAILWVIASAIGILIFGGIYWW